MHNIPTYTLQVLQLDGNQLSRLPDNFDKLENIEDLRLETNKLVHPPSDVCDGGALEPINRFLVQAEERECKI